MKDLGGKIKNLDELSRILRRQKRNGKKVVLSHGIFDLLHYGHIHYLNQAKNLGDILVTSVVVDQFITKSPGRPVFDEKIRALSVAALGCVDYVVFCHNFGPWDIISKMKPDIYAKGEDSKSQLKNPASGLNKDKKLIEENGGILKFTNSLPIHSTELLKQYFANFFPEFEAFLAKFRKKYSQIEPAFDFSVPPKRNTKKKNPA